MNPIIYIFWLIEQASGGLFYLWPVTAIIVLFIIFAFVFVLNKRKKAFYKSIIFLPLPLLGTALVLLAGTIFERKPAFDFTTHIGVGVTLLMASVSIYKTRETWPTSVGCSSFIVWFTFWCWFVSAMSISGDWL